MALASFFFAPFFLGKQYIHTAPIITIIAFAFAFDGISRFPRAVISYFKKNTLRMFLLYICGIANIITSLLLIPIFGKLGPAVGTLMAYLILSLLAYLFCFKELNRRGIYA